MMLRWENPEILPLLRYRAIPDGVEVANPHDKNAWKPGDMCRALHDSRSYGFIIAVDNEERLLILWSHNQDEGLSRDEIETLMSAFNAGMITADALRKFTGLDPTGRPHAA